MGLKEGVFKASGYYGKYKALMNMIFGTIILLIGIVFGIYLFVDTKKISSFGITLITTAVGGGMIIYGWLLWKRCNPLIQGRFW